jgi:cation diffusion facilitator family transporter
MASESKTAVAAALVGNAALAVLKGVTAALTGSAAMLAETLHSAADTGNQVLLFVGMRLTQRPPDARHPFGHGRNTYFWAFVVAMMLFTLGGAFSIRECVHKLLEPSSEITAGWSFFVLGGAFVFEAISFAIAAHSATSLRGKMPWLRYLRETRDPTVTMVLLEDSAALISIGVAASGLALAQATGRVVWDALASGVIGVILIAVAIFLAVENYSLLMGEPATPERETAVRARLASDPSVRDVLALYTMHLGPEAVLVVAQVWFRPDLTGRDIEDAVRRLEDAARGALPEATMRRMIVIEPSRPDAAIARRAA